MTLIIALLIALGINMIMFIPAFIWKTDKLTDISYAVTFATIAVAEFFIGGASWTHAILLALVLVWAFRLGGFLLIRVMKTGKDARFDAMRQNFWKFSGFWILQGITVFVVMVPSIYFLTQRTTAVNTVSWIGFGIAMLGIIIESIADWQKFQFSNNPSNTGKWIASGIWSYSRHPNYLGEMMMWIGVYLFTVSSMTTVHTIIGLVSPLYIIGLITLVSGIPILEKTADARWGNDPAYRAYKKQTSILFILPHFKK